VRPNPLTKPPRPPIQKPPKSSALPENRVRPSCEILAISAGSDAARPALRPRRKLVWFCSAPMAGFYSAVDTEANGGNYAFALATVAVIAAMTLAVLAACGKEAHGIDFVGD
jgi:hypothetical protein